MTLRFYLDGGELDAERVALHDVDSLTMAAEQGVVSAGGVTFEDPDGDMTFNGWKRFRVEEDACTPAVVWAGYVGARRISRSGTVSNYRVGAERAISCDMWDINTTAHLRVLHNASAQRPYETHGARLAWLLGSEACSGLIYDNGLVNPNGQSFDESDYRGQYGDDVIAEMATTLGYQWFLYWDEGAPAGHEISLFCDVPTGTVRTSPLQISNDLDDVDSLVTFAPSIDAVMEREPAETYSGVYYQTRLPPLYVERPPTAADYIARDGTFSTDRIGRQVSLDIASQAWLDQHSIEADRITLTVQLPKEKVNHILAGDRLEVKFTHFPDYDTFVFSRVIRRTVRQTDSWDFYDLTLELSVAIPASPGGGGAGDLPTPPCEDAVSIVQVGYGGKDTVPGPQVITMAADPTPGNLLVAFVFTDGSGEPSLISSGWTKVAFVDKAASPGQYPGPGATVGAGLWHKVVTSETAANVLEFDTHNLYECVIFECIGTAGNTTSGSATIVTGGGRDDHWTVGPVTATGNGLLLGGSALQTVDYAQFFYPVTADGGTAQRYSGNRHLYAGNATTAIGFPPQLWIGSKAGTGALTVGATSHDNVQPSPYNYIGRAWVGMVVEADTSGCQPPQTGQWVYGEVPTPAPDGSTTSFETAHSFAAGSLTVWVDRLNQTAAVTAQDGTAGTFTLGFAPKVGELVEVDYQGGGGPKPNPSLPSDLQTAIDNTAVSGTLDITGGTFVVSGVTIDHAMSLIGGTIIGTSRTADYLVTVTGDDVVLDGVTLQNAYIGVYIDEADNTTVTGCTIDGMQYAGVLTIGATNGSIDHNTISHITGSASMDGPWNAYGISFSYLGGSGDSTAMVADGNTISYVPSWHGLDTHSGVNCEFTDNTIFACRRAIFLTGSPTNVLCDGNTITAPTGSQIASAVSAGVPSATANDTRGISASGTGAITDNTGTGWFNAWWTDLGGWSGSSSGNNPSIP